MVVHKSFLSGLILVGGCWHWGGCPSIFMIFCKVEPLSENSLNSFRCIMEDCPKIHGGMIFLGLKKWCSRYPWMLVFAKMQIWNSMCIQIYIYIYLGYMIWYVNPWWISDESTAPSPNPVQCIDFKTGTFDKGVDISSTLTRSLHIYMYNIILQTYETYAMNFLLMKMSSLLSDSTKKRKCCQSTTSGEVVCSRKMQRNRWDAKHLNSFWLCR